MTITEQLNTLPNTEDCLFVELKGYRNGKGDVGNYTINATLNYEDALRHDIDFVESWEPNKRDELILQAKINETTKVAEESLSDLLKTAKEAVLVSLKKDSAQSQAQSLAQKEAYRKVGPATREHIESGSVMIRGLLHDKRLISESDKKVVNSAPKTLAKKVITEYLKTSRFNQFKIDQFDKLSFSEKTQTLILE